MANLPPVNNANITWHLSDRALFPIASSSSAPSHQNANPRTSQSQVLNSLTTSALIAYDSASRLSLGLPQRMMIEPSSPSGPVILHSYLNPRRPYTLSSRPQPRHPGQENGRTIVEAAREDLRPLSGGTASTVGVVVNGIDEEELEGEDGAVHHPPLLVATVIAGSSAHLAEARRAAAQIERFGRQFQRDWELQIEEAHTDEVAVGEDG